MPATNPNLNGSGLTINGLSTPQIAIGTGATNILTTPTAHLYRLQGMNILNNDTVARTVTWQIAKGFAGSVGILGGGGVPLSLPPGTPLYINFGGFNLQDSDILQALADLANKVHIFVTYDDLY